MDSLKIFSGNADQLLFLYTVNALYFAVFPMNVTLLEFNFVTLLEFNFADFEVIHCYHMHCQSVRVVFNIAETVHSRNKSHAKF